MNHEVPPEARSTSVSRPSHCNSQSLELIQGSRVYCTAGGPEQNQTCTHNTLGWGEKIKRSGLQYILLTVISGDRPVKSSTAATKEELSVRSAALFSTPLPSRSWDARRALMFRRAPVASLRDTDGLRSLGLWFVDKDIQPPIHHEGPSAKARIHFAASKRKRTCLDSR